MSRIHDVIREASSEHEVYFLVTSYVETVRFCDKLACLPQPVRELPLHGVDDLRSRVGDLRAGLRSGVDERARPLVEEAAEVFDQAVNRLLWLEWEKRRAWAMSA